MSNTKHDRRGDKLDPITWLRAVADDLDDAPRNGTPYDEPEGERWVKMSDTLVRELAQGLRDAAQIIHSPVQRALGCEHES